MGLFDFIARAWRGKPASEPAPERPRWMDSEFMAWLKATMPGEFNLVDSWDWSRKYAEDSLVASVVKRCNWRWEGWLGCGNTTDVIRPIGKDGPGHWWNDRQFIHWHDQNHELLPYGTKKKTAQSVAAEIIEFGAKNPHCTPEQLHNLNYEALKGLKRRWQGWCGVLQAMSGRIVCPKCGSWDVDNLGDGETAVCLGDKNEYQFCKNEWKPTWPKSSGS